MPNPPSLLSEWLYELRDSGSVVFNVDRNVSRGDVDLIRNVGVTARS